MLSVIKITDNIHHKMSKRYLDEFPLLMKQWDYELNGDLDPLTLTHGSRKIVWWKCKKATKKGGCGCIHSWQAMISSRTGKVTRGCQFCYHGSLAFQYPDIASQWHPTKNGDLTPEDVSPGSHKDVWWLCTESSCGCDRVWKVSPNDRTAKGITGCPFCIGQKRCDHESLASKYPELFEKHIGSNKDFIEFKG